jgi:hypothetical protein
MVRHSEYCDNDRQWELPSEAAAEILEFGSVTFLKARDRPRALPDTSKDHQ